MDVQSLPPPRLDKFFHHDGMYARKRLWPLCEYSVDGIGMGGSKRVEDSFLEMIGKC
jgi:hypothetical protein